MASIQNLLLFMERPTEPIFMPKGPDGVVFEIPSNFFVDKYKDLGQQLENRFSMNANTKIALKNITIPNLDLPLRLGRRENFSLFLPSHRAMAGRLIDVLMEARNLEDLQSLAAYVRDRVNPFMFNYAMSVALLHRQDTQGTIVPNIMTTFPEKYLNGDVFSRAREQATVLPDGSRTPIVIPRNNTATDDDPEHRVAYFREDLGINLHHWHWHLVYPFTANNRELVDRNRRGELFYYMHQQIVARFNAERMSVQLGRITRFDNIRQPIPEGYFPKLESNVAGRSWPPRFVNTALSDINRQADQLTIRIADVETWRQRFIQAMQQGFVTNAQGQQVPLTEQNGIDILGNIMESSILNPNQNFYGDMHNMGHLLIAYAHDPDGRFLEGASVMGDSATAMRDPIFYRWHAHIDDLFQIHKSNLPRYTAARLNYPGVVVNNVQVEIQGGQPNSLQTFWEQSDVDFSRGLDFAPRGPVFVRFTHLQHQDFTYRIQVTNNSPNQRLGMVRIFIGPRFDERGIRLPFVEQRRLMIELDKFRVNLSQGQNLIIRRSDESSVTIPYERTFRNLDAGRPGNDNPALGQFNFCGCGWPQHMLLPRGTPEGMPMDLFVMVSNYADDRVDQDLVGICNDADSYCGVQNRLYPDRRSMGYPFDRLPRDGVIALQDFLTPNMRVQPVTITFTERTTIRANNANVNPNANANPNANRIV